MKLLALLAMSGLLGCGGDSSNAPDAMSADAALDAPLPTGNALTHTLYINTEGVTLSPGMDDATMDKSTVTDAPVTVKPWLAGETDRATRIADFVAEVRAEVADYNVSVVDARPTTGSYHMLVVTDSTSQEAGLAATGGILPVNCQRRSAVVSMLFGAYYKQYAAITVRNLLATYAVAMFGQLSGIPFSKKPEDCMCYPGPQCTNSHGACTVGGAGTPIADNDCHGGVTMDERALFLAAFGPHP